MGFGQNDFDEGDSTKPPFENLDFIGSAIAQALAIKGLNQEALLLTRSSFKLEYTGYDNYDGGTSNWNYVIEIPHSSFFDLKFDEETEFYQLTNSVVSQFVPEIGHWVSLKFIAGFDIDDNWRNSIQKSIGESKVNNQGRANSRNVAGIEFEGLLFRSNPEILLYNALKQTGVPFAPLPVFVRGGTSYSRIEPDFAIIKDGVVIFVEIDGESYHKESPADAHYRLKPFQDEGVIVERVKASDCNTKEKAAVYAKKIMGLIEKRTRQK